MFWIVCRSRFPSIFLAICSVLLRQTTIPIHSRSVPSSFLYLSLPKKLVDQLAFILKVNSSFSTSHLQPFLFVTIWFRWCGGMMVFLIRLHLANKTRGADVFSFLFKDPLDITLGNYLSKNNYIRGCHALATCPLTFTTQQITTSQLLIFKEKRNMLKHVSQT